MIEWSDDSLSWYLSVPLEVEFCGYAALRSIQRYLLSCKMWNTISNRRNFHGQLIKKKSKSVFSSASFAFFILYCLLQTAFRVLFLCVFLSLAALLTVVPTSAPPPLLWWFTFLLDWVLGELIWLKNTPFFWVACHFKLRSVAWSSSLRGLMKSSIGIAGAVQFWVHCSSLLPEVMAERNARGIGLSCFPCWCKSVRCDFFRKKRTWILLFCSSWYLHVLYFSSFSSVFSKVAWFSAGYSLWPTIPNF